MIIITFANGGIDVFDKFCVLAPSDCKNMN